MNFNRPRGDITTVLDLINRDDQDNILFPLDSENSLFTKNALRRIHPFSTSLQEFSLRGTPAFGSKLTFDISSTAVGDLLMSVLLQVHLNHWLPEYILEALQDGSLTYATGSPKYTWCNSLGTVLIEKAELQVDDQIIETIDGDFMNVYSTLFLSAAEQIGLSTDAIGRYPLTNGNTSLGFPTNPNGFISCILPFGFERNGLPASFPLISCKEGTIRITITLRPFTSLIQRIDNGGLLEDCNDTPVGKTFSFKNSANEITYYTVPSIPHPKDILAITSSSVLDGALREAYLRKAHDLLYRECNTFRFSEPLKYVIGTPSSDTVLIQLPLEANGPIEEVIWIVRRKKATLQNEWINYSGVLKDEWNATFNPFKGLVVSSKIQGNGIDIVESDGDYFREFISEKHKGGYNSWNNYIYGYSFAKTPGEFQPSGSINVSRLNSFRLSLTISQPTPADEWEVIVYCIGLNWIRFENGIVNKVFSD